MVKQNIDPKCTINTGFDAQTIQQLNDGIDRAIQKNTEIGDIRNEPVFVLCQYFKGIVKDDTPVGLLEPYLKIWYKKCQVIQDEYDDYEEVFLLFADVWENKRVKYAKKATFEIAKQRAENQTEIRPEIAWCDKPNLIKLDNVCYELQKLQGDKPFFISQYDAGKLMGKCDRTGRNALDYLTGKTIRLVKRGIPGKGIANSYRYINTEKLKSVE